MALRQEEKIMSKGQDSKKNIKKKPLLNAKRKESRKGIQENRNQCFRQLIIKWPSKSKMAILNNALCVIVITRPNVLKPRFRIEPTDTQN